jgi:hypothetical protein
VEWILGLWGKKWEKRGFGWPAVGGYCGEGPGVVSQWWERWMSEVGWVYLDFREERTGDGRGGAVRLAEEMKKRKRKCDLKTVHAGLKLSTFERT